MLCPIADVLKLICWAVIEVLRSSASLEPEILTLRCQLNVLRRKFPKRSAFSNFDRLIFVGLFQIAPRVVDALTIVEPETAIRWHRGGFRLFWRWKSRSRRGRPKVQLEIRQLIRDMSLVNPPWGAPRIHGELLKLGIEASRSSVGNICPSDGDRRVKVGAEQLSSFLARQSEAIKLHIEGDKGAIDEKFGRDTHPDPFDVRTIKAKVQRAGPQG